MCNGSGFEYSQLLITVPVRSELSLIGFFSLFFFFLEHMAYFVLVFLQL